jgi:hypothetical protein
MAPRNRTGITPAYARDHARSLPSRLAVADAGRMIERARR